MVRSFLLASVLVLTKLLADPDRHDFWTLSVVLIATSMAALCEQAFLIHRFFTLYVFFLS